MNWDHQQTIPICHMNWAQSILVSEMSYKQLHQRFWNKNWSVCNHGLKDNKSAFNLKSTQSTNATKIIKKHFNQQEPSPLMRSHLNWDQFSKEPAKSNPLSIITAFYWQDQEIFMQTHQLLSNPSKKSSKSITTTTITKITTITLIWISDKELMICIEFMICV